MDERGAHFDVVCIGGAMMGSSVAYFLSENTDFDGSVLVVEPDWTYDRAATTRAQNSIREQFTNPLNHLWQWAPPQALLRATWLRHGPTSSSPSWRG